MFDIFSKRTTQGGDGEYIYDVLPQPLRVQIIHSNVKIRPVQTGREFFPVGFSAALP